MHPDEIASAGEALAAAHAGETLDGLTALPRFPAEAYAVQAESLRHLGPVGGWKHALLGGRDLSCAPVLAAAIHSSGASLPVAPDARIELEIAVRLRADIAPEAKPVEIFEAIGGLHIAFELLQSRFTARETQPPIAQMADRFSNQAIILGDEIPDWRARDLSRLPLSIGTPADPSAMAAGMSFSEIVSFLSFLAERASVIGPGLRADHYVVTGARIGPKPLAADTQVQGVLDGYQVSLTTYKH
ncbi:2-keto-4-pentenoate hydratase [Thioclava sp. ES.031]|uniref:hydratase n=1 Tax=Thioclava sp. ES.031 TaxID=1798203 RepID=UPI000BF33F4D|nr:hydratase [Thioclava sp. ES.031]PFG64830.1 2-keto-4-pentenoate hydratase [Thioclava sp. ES.031]